MIVSYTHREGGDHTRSSREDNRRISVITSFVGEDTEAEEERGDK